jgi:hypothetical protein
MSDFIEIAPYIKDMEFVNESSLISEFVQASGAAELRRLDMNLLRNYHRSNKEKCINLIDELALRGFIFHLERPSSVLPSRVYEIDNACIFVRHKSENFRDINFRRLGLANFVERFDVRSDYFFQYIKVDNFLHINSRLSLEMLKEEFLKCGFNFINMNELVNGSFDSKRAEDNSKRQSSSKAGYTGAEGETACQPGTERMLLFLRGAARLLCENDIRIEDVFRESSFRIFRDFCRLYDLYYMGQLQGMHFEDLIFFRNFGKEKVRRAEERYREYKDGRFKHSTSGLEEAINPLQAYLAAAVAEPMASGTSIDNVFEENSFNKFRSFCEENGLLYAEQLEDFPFDHLTQLRGFGESKVSSIKERYYKFVTGEFVAASGKVYTKNLSDIEIHENYFDLEIDCLVAVDIDESMVEELKKRKLYLVKDLLKLKYSDLTKIRNMGKTKINRFMTNIKLLRKSPEVLMKEVLSTIKENEDFEIFKERTIGKHTLQEIGEKYKVSKERIRQKEKKIFKLFESFFTLFRKQVFGDIKRGILDMEAIRNMFKDDGDMLHIKYALISENYSPAVYFEELDKFLINIKPDDVRIKLDAIIEENIGDICNFYNELIIVDEALKDVELDFIDIGDFLTYAKRKGYRECGNYLIKRGTSTRSIYKFILREYFPQGIKLSDPKDIETVLIIARDEFKLERHSEDDVSSVAAMIVENVLCDRATYIHPNYINVPMPLMEKIKCYILESSEDTLLTADVFHKFEEELREKSNIRNRYFLHGVLRYYYEEQFSFVRDKVSIASGEILSTNKILQNFLKEQGGPVSREKIKEQFPGWSEVMIQNAEQINKNIIKWDTRLFNCAENLIIAEEDKEKLRNAIEVALTEYNGYCNAMAIYKKLQLKMHGFYKKNGISNYINLFYVLKYLFEDTYYFRKPHILREKTDNQFTTMDMFMKAIEERDTITYEELSNYLVKKLKFNETTIFAARKKFSSKLIEIRKGEYMLKDKFPVTEELLNKIKEFIEQQLSGKEYVPMLSIIDYRILPDIGYDWNPYMLQDIIEDNLPEYRFVEKDIRDRRYRYSSIVRRGSQIGNIVELIIYILENEYKDKENMTVQSIQQYLILKNIIHNLLPYDFLSSERVRIDEFHRIEIK